MLWGGAVLVRRIDGVPKVRHVFWQGSQLTCRFLVEIGDLYLESKDLPIRPANEWEQQAFDTLAEFKRVIDSGPADQNRIKSLDAEILRREERLGKALSVQHLVAEPVALKPEDWKDTRAYALYAGAVWRSDLTDELGRDEMERQFEPTGAEESASREAIPAAVRRAVWQRDQGRCARCGRRERLEFDHIVPVSRGGSSTERNIELLCESCNRTKSDRIG
jgi:5-methylcytosine-specific restriction endonuclease McrA